MEDDYMFSHTGFRWDFLLYSAMPMWLGWYGSEEKISLIAIFVVVAYILAVLANAFWVMLIRASYSNRFAYFVLVHVPVVLAYPFVDIADLERLWKKVGTDIMGYILHLLNVDQRMIGKKNVDSICIRLIIGRIRLGERMKVYVDRLVRILSGWL
ncbi:MAG: hypothetical protein ACLR6J_14180 [Parabacteroides merdae]